MSLLKSLLKKITKVFPFMEFPLSMSRQGDFPLDKSSLWWDLQEATNYAKNDPTAYPGQPITVVDEGANTVKLYLIGTDGSLVAQGEMASVDALRQELTAHKADYDKLKAAYDQTKADVTKLRQDHDALQTAHNELNGKHAALDTKVTELDAHEKQLKSDHDALAAKHNKLQEDHTALNGKVTTLSGKHDTLQGEVITLSGKHDALEGKHNTLQQAHDTLAADEAQLKKDHEALKTAFESKVYTADEITETATRVFVTPAQKAVIDTVVYATEADIDELFPELKPKP